MTKSERYILSQEAYKLVGLPPDTICGDAAVAINCAIDMGYRTPESVATMARKLFTPPPRADT